jgi:hydroxymethylpyrimidine pyrophosphatase-like HAD family hydrolase
VSNNCLIAADIDRTLLTQDEANNERRHFVRKVGPALLDAARNGAHLAFVTGNSIDELGSRFITWLSQQLVFNEEVGLLPQMHFFSNSAGVYAHFPSDDPTVASAIDAALDPSVPREAMTSRLIDSLLTNARTIRAAYIDVSYLQRCTISPPEASTISAILDDASDRYVREIGQNWSRYESDYSLQTLMKDGRIEPPAPDSREVTFHHPNGDEAQATVQLTLKPVLSWRHAYNPEKAIGKDPRSHLSEWVQNALDEARLAHYVARPGGRSSIDITLEKVDKAYALEFLIDRLNLQGTERRNERFGTNAVYFGDEVLVGAGNDYSITRIPGVLVFAVNRDRDLIPALHQVFVPSAILEGPSATADILNMFNRCASRMPNDTVRALRVFKRELCFERIRGKIDGLAATELPVEDWQILHAFVSLMARNDDAARAWLTILIAELDSIMVQVGSSGGRAMHAFGMSHPDW